MDKISLNQEPDVEIFDPPMCCPTGLCGPTLDMPIVCVRGRIMIEGSYPKLSDIKNNLIGSN